MDRCSVWLTDRLSVWLTVWLIDLLTVWLIDRLTARLTLASVTLDYLCIFIFPCYPTRGIGLVTIKSFKSRLSLIVRVNVVLNRTVVVDSDWHFDNLCGSHLQSQSELYHVSWWYYTLVTDLIGQLRRDVIGRLSVKPWCYWLWRFVIGNWCVSIRLLSQLNSRLLLVKLSVLQSFSRS